MEHRLFTGLFFSPNIICNNFVFNGSGSAEAAMGAPGSRLEGRDLLTLQTESNINNYVRPNFVLEYISKLHTSKITSDLGCGTKSFYYAGQS